MSQTTIQISTDPMTPLRPEMMRETLCRECGEALAIGDTDALNVWDGEAGDAIIHPAATYAAHDPQMVGVIGPGAGRFECAACAEMHEGTAFVFERERPSC
ncbi:hypothetical protein [Micrococcus luteus]|uniref:hypothetical protein n=1 Tax=Micrococcus luteus TaxID=1270 RepID=UPI00301AA51E